MKNPDSSQDTPDSAWDDLFRQRLADYTDQPPADALNRILTGAGALRPQPYRQWAPVSLAILLLLGAGGWLFLHQYKTVEKPATGVANRPNPIAKANPAIAQTADNRAGPVNPLPVPSTRVADMQVASRPPSVQLPASTDFAPVSTAAGSVPARRYTSERRVVAAGRLQPQPIGNRVQQRGTPYLPQLQEEPGDVRVDTPVSHYTYLTASPLVRPASTGPTVDFLAARPFRVFTTLAALPAILAGEPVTQLQASRPRRRPAWFVSLTPLYTYQAINPIHTDAELVSDIRVARPLATDRLGARLQLGTEWRLAGRLSVRTSLVYQQVRQSLRYAVRSAQPDSVQVMVIDNQSVQATPFFARQTYTETAVWHYAGLSTDMVWQLNRRVDNRWQHYLTLGATVGRYVSRGGLVNGFIQAGYGVERPLTTSVRLRIEPTVQLGWQPVTDQAQRFQSRPYGYGVALSLRFR